MLSTMLNILKACLLATVKENSLFDDASYLEELNMLSDKDCSDNWNTKCQSLEKEFDLTPNTHEQFTIENDISHVFLFNSINGTLDTTLFASSEKIALPHHLKSWPDVVIKLNALYKEILGKNEHLYIKFKQTLQAYNSNSDLGSFTNLDSVFTKPSLKNAFTGSVLPRMISLALQVEFLFPQGLPRLVCGGDIKSLTLSQRQIACLLSNLFLCTFTDKMGSSVNLETESKNHKYIGVSFVRLFSSKKQSSVEKLKALINYFAKVTMACNTSYKQHHLILSTDDNAAVLPGCVTYARVKTDKIPDFTEEAYTKKTCQIRSNMNIEDFCGCVQVDFANKNIGGGILRYGAVQEEIMIICRPEIICARLFTATLNKDESLHIVGSECFNQVSGYSVNIKWAGNYIDNSERDIYGRRKSNICAIDALRVNSKCDNFKTCNIDRDLKKAFSGFKPYAFQNNIYNAIASGFWGCGAFKGDKEMKALIQLIACMMARRQLIFLTFGDSKFEERFTKMLDQFEDHNVTDKQLYNLIVEIPDDGPSAFEFIYEHLHVQK
ncbi:hypothetical protein GJ496_007722 [Pomphorhynchus laevis]|nr:hypothetical protein GJ496_007722 [Pomphorhynchus laevis]